MRQNTMKKSIKSDLLEQEEVREALDLFVEYGILIKVKKNGEDAWKNSPIFDKMSKKEQQKVFDRMAMAESISQEAIRALTSSDE